MAQYIQKDALVAEIEKQKQLIFPKNTGEMKVVDVPKPLEQGWLNALSWIKKTIDTLEVEEVQEEPVSEELDKAAKNVGQEYFPDEYNIWARPNYEAVKAEYAFKDGAKWKERQVMAKAKGGTVQKDYQIIMDDETYIDLDPSMQLKPAFNVNEGDKVKVIVTKEG